MMQHALQWHVPLLFVGPCHRIMISQGILCLQTRCKLFNQDCSKVCLSFSATAAAITAASAAADAAAVAAASAASGSLSSSHASSVMKP